MRYVDNYGLYNVKPVGEDGKPTGNDGLIISAYADKAGLMVDIYNLRVGLWHKLKARNGFPIERLPGKETPYPSRDFYLAAKWFEFEKTDHLKRYGWNFSPFKLPSINPFKLVAQAALAIGKDRNFFWENKLDQIYRFAFSIPLHDRAFYFNMEVIHAPKIYALIEWVDRKFFKAGNNSSKLIRWLKYNEMPKIEVFEEYFGKDHPITLKIRGE